MAWPDTQIESPAEREAGIRRKNRRMVPWIIAAALAPFIVLAALLAAILGPSLIKVHQIMSEPRTEHAAEARPLAAPVLPERAAHIVTGDFDRDGRPDTARLVRSGDTYDLVIQRAAPGAAPDVVETITVSQASNYFLVLATPGIYQTWCGRGGATEAEPCPALSLTLSGDVLAFGFAEAGESVAVWDGERFTTIQMSG